MIFLKIKLILILSSSCGSWVFAQFYLMISKKLSRKGLVYWLLAFLWGFFGLYTTMNLKLNYWLCRTFGCHFAGGFWWYLCTPICAYL